MDAPSNTNFSFGRFYNPKSLKTRYTNHAHILWLWFIEIIYFWYVEPTQNKQRTFPPSSWLFTCINSSWRCQQYHCVLFVTKTHKQTDNNGIISTNFKRMFQINKYPMCATILTSSAKIKRRRSKNPLNRIYGLFAHSFAYHAHGGIPSLASKWIFPAYFVCTLLPVHGNVF